jgi:hypothetical protein
VHPRSRDGTPTSDAAHFPSGSSPLARGRLQTAGDADALSRFTPARAGTASARHASACPEPVPPAHAGRRDARRGSARRRRSTPARAGTAGPRRCPPPGGPVHPRSRGDGRMSPRPRLISTGSPPLARGRPATSLGRTRQRRLTPAPAGTASAVPRGRARRPVHPRSRGDGGARLRVAPDGTGLPPLPRGRLHDRVVQHPLERFTPARAATARPSRADPTPPPVHPRSRGDGSRTWPPNSCACGSPPLARGRLVRLSLGERLQRSTPTRAGTALRPRQDAPRCCCVFKVRALSRSPGGLRSHAAVGSPCVPPTGKLRGRRSRPPTPAKMIAQAPDPMPPDADPAHLSGVIRISLRRPLAQRLRDSLLCPPPAPPASASRTRSTTPANGPPRTAPSRCHPRDRPRPMPRAGSAPAGHRWGRRTACRRRAGPERR